MLFEKNVPLPSLSRAVENQKSASNLKARSTDWAKMEVGDSYFFRSEEYEKRSTANCAYMYGSRTGKKFKTKRCEGGFRIWRLK